MVRPVTVCAVYARVSTDMQGESLQNQVEYAKEYIRRLGEGYVVDEACVYTDFDQSGYYTRFVQRPAIQRALADARAGRFGVIVFKEISRISRDQAEHIEIVSRFQMHGVRVIAINDNLDSDRPETLDLLGIHSVMSEMESKRISSRVSSGKKSMARRGCWVGEAPIGYRVEPGTRRLEIDRLHAPTVMDIFRLADEEGYGALRIARWLNERGRHTKNGRPWSSVTVRRVLQNPAYTGDTVYGRTRNTLRRIFDDRGYTKVRGRRTVPEDEWVVVRDTHPALVDRAVFHRIQARFRGSRGADRVPKAAGTGASLYAGGGLRGRHPLSGLLRCGRCGATLVCQRQRRQGREYRYYVCGRAFRHGRPACDQPNLPAFALETALWNWLAERLAPVAEGRIRYWVAGDPVSSRRHRLEAERKRLEQALERLLLDDEVPGETADSIRRRLVARLHAVERELAECLEMARAGSVRLGDGGVRPDAPAENDMRPGNGEARPTGLGVPCGQHPPGAAAGGRERLLRVCDVLPLWRPMAEVPPQEAQRTFRGLVESIVVDGVRVTEVVLRHRL
ncbi:recombinase family protein [Alicyclobacillus sp.]|uniref:recombinase family protein n=1 Tax=Alicyclobacillus sp. TaxID=61169 RepID=UPI0025BFED35|nr:recombinase family protein [Alicyclobacillus sp.]MCL6516786.1 recombinase family protein [Alicyclobacillus sp.]